MSKVRQAVRSVSDTTNRVVIVVCIMCILGMLGISFIGFTYTVVTGGALSWTYSLARLFLPWIGLLSITIALHSGEHVAMTILVRAVPATAARVCAYVVLAMMALFGGLMIWYGWGYFQTATQYYMVSDQIQVHARWTAAAVPITGAVFLIHVLRGIEIVNFGALEESSEYSEAAEQEAAE